MEDRPLRVLLGAPTREVISVDPMSKNRPKKIRVGIIGVSPDRGWAADAHIPALK